MPSPAPPAPHATANGAEGAQVAADTAMAEAPGALAVAVAAPQAPGPNAATVADASTVAIAGNGAGQSTSTNGVANTKAGVRKDGTVKAGNHIPGRLPAPDRPEGDETEAIHKWIDRVLLPAAIKTVGGCRIPLQGAAHAYAYGVLTSAVVMHIIACLGIPSST
jgi:hypothetical protein